MVVIRSSDAVVGQWLAGEPQVGEPAKRHWGLTAAGTPNNAVECAGAAGCGAAALRRVDAATPMR